MRNIFTIRMNKQDKMVSWSSDYLQPNRMVDPAYESTQTGDMKSLDQHSVDQELVESRSPAG